MGHRHESSPPQMLHLAGGAAALKALPRSALPLDYPSRPVKILDGFPAGGAVDIVARLIGDWLSQRLGTNFSSKTDPAPQAISQPKI
jgi:tripartite-type tricarboxylate transporter receptor subunit TctC